MSSVETNATASDADTNPPMAISGNNLFASDGYLGVEAYDITNPMNPVPAGMAWQLDTSGYRLQMVKPTTIGGFRYLHASTSESKLKICRVENLPGF